MQIELPEKFIEELSERVRQKLLTEERQHHERLDSDALEFQHKLSRINAKQNISIQEAAVLLNRSDGHIRNLVKKAKHKRTRHPIPFLDLDGVTTFDREELLAWSRRPKERAKNGNNEVQSEPNL
jgi:hypothetical protein